MKTGRASGFGALCLLVAALSAGAALAAAPASPQALTGWRTGQGVMLSWSVSTTAGLAVWRAADGKPLELLAILPAGQVGYLDLGAERDLGYLYALGTERQPDPLLTLKLRALAGKAGISAGLVTTCSGLARDRKYPADTQNYFQMGRDGHVQFYGYFILNPYDQTPRQVRLVWKDPESEVFSEFGHSLVPQAVRLPTGLVGQILIMQAVGLKEALPQNGQKKVPVVPGLYLVEVSIDGELVATTVFYLKDGSGAQDSR